MKPEDPRSRFLIFMIESEVRIKITAYIIQSIRGMAGHMKLENCLQCKYHNDYINGQILCNYSSNINSMATYADEKTVVVYVIGCPKDKF